MKNLYSNSLKLKKKPLKFGNKKNKLIKILAKKLEAIQFNPTDPFSSKQQLNFLSGSETGS